MTTWAVEQHDNTESEFENLCFNEQKIKKSWPD